MENSSKALIMAGEILIGILIMSLAVYLFIVMRQPAEIYIDELAPAEVIRFNVAFERLIGRNDITVQEIISVRNFAIANIDRVGTTNVSMPGFSALAAVDARGQAIHSDEYILRRHALNPPTFSLSEGGIGRTDGRITRVSFE